MMIAKHVRPSPVDIILPARERVNILGRVANVDDLQLDEPKRKLMHANSEKPVLSCLSMNFYVVYR